MSIRESSGSAGRGGGDEHDESELSDLTDDEPNGDNGVHMHPDAQVAYTTRRKRSSTFIPSPMWTWAVKKKEDSSDARDSEDLDEKSAPKARQKDAEDASDNEGQDLNDDDENDEDEDDDEGDNDADEDEGDEDKPEEDEDDDEDTKLATPLMPPPQSSIMAGSQILEPQSLSESSRSASPEPPKHDDGQQPAVSAPDKEDDIPEKDPDISMDALEPDQENDQDLEIELDMQPAHRAEALDVLAAIELKFALLREAVYVEKMQGLAWEESLVQDGNHPELLHLHRELLKRRDKRVELATRRSQHETENVRKKRRIDEDIVWEWWKHARDELQTDMIAETNRKRRRLERNRRLTERPPPDRSIPSCPLEIPHPPTIHQLVHSFPFEGNDMVNDDPPDTPQSPENLVYPELKTLPEDEIRHDLDRILNRPPAFEPVHYGSHPFGGEGLPPLGLQLSGPPPQPGFEQYPPEHWQMHGRPIPGFPHHPTPPGLVPPGPLPGMPPNLFPPPPNQLGPSRLPHSHPGMFGPPGGPMFFGHEPEMSTMVSLERPHQHGPPPGFPPHNMPYAPPHPRRSLSPGPNHATKQAGSSNPWAAPSEFPGYAGGPGPRHGDWREEPGVLAEEERARADRERRNRVDPEDGRSRDYSHRDYQHLPQRPPPHNGLGFLATASAGQSSMSSNPAHRHHHHVVHHHHGSSNPDRQHIALSHQGESTKMHPGPPPAGPHWQDNDRDGRMKYGMRTGPSPSLETIPFAMQASSSSMGGMTSEKPSTRSPWMEDGPFRKAPPSPFSGPPPTNFPPERRGPSPTHRYGPSSSSQPNYGGRAPPSLPSRPMGLGGMSPRAMQHPSDPSYLSGSQGPSPRTGNNGKSHRPPTPQSSSMGMHSGPPSIYPSPSLSGPGEPTLSHPFGPKHIGPPGHSKRPSGDRDRERERDRDRDRDRESRSGHMSVSSMVER